MSYPQEQYRIFPTSEASGAIGVFRFAARSPLQVLHETFEMSSLTLMNPWFQRLHLIPRLLSAFRWMIDLFRFIPYSQEPHHDSPRLHGALSGSYSTFGGRTGHHSLPI